MFIDLYCECGNPNCENTHVLFRKGYVQITDLDGTKRERGDYFYVDAYKWKEGDADTTNVEIMLPPEAARALMWFMISTYMPVLSRLYCWWLRVSYRWDSWRYRIFKRFKK